MISVELRLSAAPMRTGYTVTTYRQSVFSPWYFLINDYVVSALELRATLICVVTLLEYSMY